MIRRGKLPDALAYCAILLVFGSFGSAIAGPRGNERQPELDYHQPIVNPGSNHHHRKGNGSGGTEPATGPCTNPVACENLLTGDAPATWRLLEPGNAAVQGFATDQSVNIGGTVRFKVRAVNIPYHIDIYRVGWYGGNGARRVAQLGNIPLQTQPPCQVDTSNTTGLIDCGNWLQSATWVVPSTAVSGVYFARLVRNDNNAGLSYIFFNVRDDNHSSQIVYQTSDVTRAAYNNYGGNSLYQCTVACPPGNPQLYKAAYKVSFNRPNVAVALGMQYSFFGAEFELVEFLEANGYDVSYISSIDTDRAGALLKNHKIFISSGHDEYWSGAQRNNVEAARNAGVNLAFFSGNAIYWKTRYEDNNRTLVTYKETHFDAVVDPKAPIWTGEWRDARFSPPGDGGRPENALMGTAYMVDPPTDFALKVPAADGKMRFWRKTTVATQSSGQTATLAPKTLGYEFDSDLDNGFRPAGIVHLSTNTESVKNLLIDVGNNYNNGVATHHLTLYRAPSGALVFGAGTVQWAWGLEGSPDGTAPFDVRMQQATVNLFADMGVQPTTLITGLVAAAKSNDSTGPVSTITSPAPNFSAPADTMVNVIGTATDSGGGVVGGVEVSTDGGLTWHPANGRENWIYQWQPLQSGNHSLMSRAVDDSANLGAASTPRAVTITNRTCPCGIWPTTSAPVSGADADSNKVELGVKFYADTNGTIRGIRYFKSTSNTGTHTGSLWSANGQLLASATFSGESASGWQQVNFTTPVTINAGTHYVASYHTNTGHYAGDAYYFFNSGFDNPPLHALKHGADGGNGVYVYGTGGVFPSNTYKGANYWVDVAFTPTGGGGDTTPPSVSSRNPAINATGVPVSTIVTATFNEAVQPPNVNNFTLRNGANPPVAATVSYNASTFTATLTPSQALAPSATYTATVAATDVAGNTMNPPVSWSFTTAAASQANCPCTIWPASATPGVAADADAKPVEVGVKFRSDMSGFITGLRFYKSSANTGTHVASLWNAGGGLLGQATFGNETGSGWQQVTFSPAIAVTANTTYVASYHTNTGHYAADEGFFASTGVDKAPLHALRNGVSGTNGVYAYSGSSTFPTNSFNSTNYWVDVVFQTTTSAPPNCPCSIWPATAAPVLAADADGSSVELGVKFQADINGRVTGIRFYKAASNVGPHTASLWTATGTLLASVPVTNETASGWQQVSFPNPIPVTAGTIYVASYHTNSGHYADDAGYFANNGVDRPPLHALKNGGSSGANGLYIYSASTAFPTNAFQSSNYWVDVVFISP